MLVAGGRIGSVLAMSDDPPNDPRTQALVDALIEQEAPTGRTLAVLALRGGQVVAEGYAPTAGPETTLISWSMAKSVTHALIGLLVGDGLIDVDDAAPVPEWRDDARASITIQQLLNMRSGLRFVEDYVDDTVSDCIEMLFASGKDDVAAYAAALPLEHQPGEVFSYSSGTTNILCRAAGQLVGGGEDGMRAYLQARLFGPLGMTSADPRFDAAGTFIGSSFLYCTARDFAAFGELYRTGGGGLLPAGWTDHAWVPTPTPPTERHGYGAHWWRWDHIRGLCAQGYEGQRILIVPERELTLVRLGKTVADDGPALDDYLSEIAESVG